MKPALILLGTVFLALEVFAQEPREEPQIDSVPIPKSCSSPSDLQTYLNALGERYTSQPVEGSLPPRVMARKDQPAFEEFFKRCADKLTDKTRSCFHNVREYLKTQHRFGEEPVRGQVLKNPHYDQAKEAFPQMVEVPKTLKDGLTPEWLKKFDSCKTGPASEDREFCEETKTWKILRFRSMDCGVTTMPVAIVHIPGKNFDRWLNYRGYDQVRNDNPPFAQMISVMKKDPKTQSTLSNPIPYWTTYIGTDRMPDASQNCIGCHTGGLNSIVPIPGSIDSNGAKIKDELNGVINSYGRIDVAKHFDLKSFGPEVGTFTCTRCHGANRNSMVHGTRAFQKVMLNQDMPIDPAHRRDTPFHQAIEKTHALSAEEREKIMKLYRGETEPRPIEQPQTCDPDKLNGAREKHLARLKEIGAISEKEHTDALKDLKRRESDSQEIWGRIEKDLAAKNKTWLRGENENCVKSAIEADRPRVAPSYLLK